MDRAATCMKLLYLQLPEALVARLDECARHQGRTRRAVLLKALEAYTLRPPHAIIDISPEDDADVMGCCFKWVPWSVIEAVDRLAREHERPRRAEVIQAVRRYLVEHPV